MKILRYRIATEVQIPQGAVLIDVQPGQSGISAWFLCEPSAPMETRRFATVATGQDLPEAIMDCRHLITIKALIPCGPDGHKEMVSTALHIFDTTDCKAKIPSLKIGASQPSKDPADWWKE
jgi:hypothetical protein